MMADLRSSIRSATLIGGFAHGAHLQRQSLLVERGSTPTARAKHFAGLRTCPKTSVPANRLSHPFQPLGPNQSSSSGPVRIATLHLSNHLRLMPLFIRFSRTLSDLILLA
jgi:hypothetical protein